MMDGLSSRPRIVRLQAGGSAVAALSLTDHLRRDLVLRHPSAQEGGWYPCGTVTELSLVTVCYSTRQ